MEEAELTARLLVLGQEGATVPLLLLHVARLAGGVLAARAHTALVDVPPGTRLAPLAMRDAASRAWASAPPPWAGRVFLAPAVAIGAHLDAPLTLEIAP